MTRIITVLISWIRMSALSMAAFARGTVSRMTGNPIYATPIVPLATMSTAALRVETAWANRKNGASAQEELNLAKADMDLKLHQQASYVNGIANGDVQKILSAGFSPAHVSSTPSVKPNAPVAPVLKPIGAGKLLVSIPHVAGDDNYSFVVITGTPFDVRVVDNHMVIPSEAANVVILPIAHSHEEISGLTPGSQVTVLVFAHNSAGLSDASPRVSTFIL